MCGDLDEELRDGGDLDDKPRGGIPDLVGGDGLSAGAVARAAGGAAPELARARICATSASIGEVARSPEMKIRRGGGEARH